MTAEPDRLPPDLDADLIRPLEETFTLLDVLSGRYDDPEAEQAIIALSRATRALTALVRRPDQLDVGQEHRDAAVELTTAYLDRADGHRLLLGSLTGIDDRCRVDPGFRVGLIAALAQLVADVLVTTVAAAGNEIGELDQQDLDGACRALLSRLAVVTQQ